jgi:hypothetical protein
MSEPTRGRTTTVSGIFLTPLEYEDGTANVEWAASLWVRAELESRDRWRRYSREHRTAHGLGDFPSVRAARALIAGFASVEKRRSQK